MVCVCTSRVVWLWNQRWPIWKDWMCWHLDNVSGKPEQCPDPKDERRLIGCQGWSYSIFKIIFIDSLEFLLSLCNFGQVLAFTNLAGHYAVFQTIQFCAYRATNVQWCRTFRPVCDLWHGLRPLWRRNPARGSASSDCPSFPPIPQSTKKSNFFTLSKEVFR